MHQSNTEAVLGAAPPVAPVDLMSPGPAPMTWMPVADHRPPGACAMVIGPIVLMLAAIPLIVGKVSPDGPLGRGAGQFEQSEQEWYRGSRVAGAAFLAGGLVWLAAAMLLPGHFDTLRQEHETIALIGATAAAIATVVSTLYVEGGSAPW